MCVSHHTVPALPLDISILELGADYIEITWQPGSGDFSNYLIQYYPIGPTTPDTIIMSKSDEREQGFYDLSPGTLYTITVIQQGIQTVDNTIVHYTREYYGMGTSRYSKSLL